MRPLTRGFLKWTRTLHIYLSVFALLALLFFAATGFMLIHAEWFDLHEPRKTTLEGKVPAEVLTAPLDEERLVRFLRIQFGLAGKAQVEPEDNHKDESQSKHEDNPAEDTDKPDESGSPKESKDEPEHKCRVVFKSPGKTADLTVDVKTGEVKGEVEVFGLAGVLTDLHKSGDENTSPAWRRVVDGVSILLMLISLTGLFLWASLRRRLVLGVIALFTGAVIPTVVYFFFLI